MLEIVTPIPIVLLHLQAHTTLQKVSGKTVNGPRPSKRNGKWLGYRITNNPPTLQMILESFDVHSWALTKLITCLFKRGGVCRRNASETLCHPNGKINQNHTATLCSSDTWPRKSTTVGRLLLTRSHRRARNWRTTAEAGKAGFGLAYVMDGLKESLAFGIQSMSPHKGSLQEYTGPSSMLQVTVTS